MYMHTYVFGCELTIDMYMYVYICIWTYLRECVNCVWPYVFCIGTTYPI